MSQVRVNGEPSYHTSEVQYCQLDYAFSREKAVRIWMTPEGTADGALTTMSGALAPSGEWGKHLRWSGKATCTSHTMRDLKH